jgi:hypothetical protein
MAAEVVKWLEDGGRRQALQLRFSELHDSLRCDASARAALSIVDLLQ